MGFKKVNQYKLFEAIPVTGSATYTSDSQNIANLDNIFIQVRFVGTMSGTLEIQASADNLEWDTFTFSTPLPQPAGTDTSYAVNLNQVSALSFHIVYTNTAGTGTLSITYFSKDLN